jgi:hypothetical protein
MPAVDRCSREAFQVRTLAGTAALVLVVVWAIRAFVPGAAAPRVHVRWDVKLEEPDRRGLERRFTLSDGARIDGTTWAYDLVNPSSTVVREIVAHPAVADTHYIERATGEVSADAPAGRTRIHGGLSVARDSRLFAWAERFSAALVLMSGVWLLTDGRTRRTRQGDAIEHRHTGNDPV